jgi:predicted phosphatase
MLLKNKIIFFDLDKTIWNCFDKYNNKIWAKQLIAPYRLVEENKIIDDVGSICQLDVDFIDFINSLNLIDYGFCSNGAILNVDFLEQPSKKLIDLFSIKDYKYFILQYKIESKKQSIEKLFSLQTDVPNVILVDDDDDVLSTFINTNITTIDRKLFKNWKEINEFIR